MTPNIKFRPWALLVPVAGAMSFLALYFVATLYYPGGSQADTNSTGFSWKDNYWCNLLADQAINGATNKAQPIAVSSMFVLSATLAFFWVLLPSFLYSGNRIGTIIRVSGLLSMATALLLYSNFSHDTIINLASTFGVIATSGTLIALYKTRHFMLFAFGLAIIVLVGLNNYFYYGGGGIEPLPVVQKITFVSYLLWICAISVVMFRKANAALP